MMRKTLLVLLFMSGVLGAFAQPLDMFVPYRSKENPGYWKNRPPYPGYWQQDVHYTINASLDDSTNIITGSEGLTYYNNSPDALPIVYFHLYQNAFVPGSYMSDLYDANKEKVTYGINEKAGLGTIIGSMEAGGKNLKTELYNTILKVYLPAPLQPGDSITFHISFKTGFDEGSMRRRMKMFRHNGFKQYDGVHWYPRIAVYDRYNGWNIDQHLGHEFYGDYGTYDVSLTLPNQYVLDGTGVLLNRQEVLPDTLRRKLDVKNFAKKPIGEKPSVIIKPDGTTKTWRFHAINVHDFGWTADPTYRIGEYEWNGVQCIALAQEENAGGWQTAAVFTANVISIYSQDFGMYGYPKIIVADARDGMEYPMMTLCGGTAPGYHFVIAHELGHEWFFGMLGNNETYRAFLDEGFTQFLSVWSLDQLSRIYDPTFPFWREYHLFATYILESDNPDIPPALSTHSDDFNSAIGHGGGYGEVYYKGGTMLYNLKYVLGDTLFLSAMQHYVSQYKYCHPYPKDFRESIIHSSGQNLAWFFDEWYDTHKVIDYGIKSLKKAGDGRYKIRFVRQGGMQMPVHFSVITKDSSHYSFVIPNQPDQQLGAPGELPLWLGWGKLNKYYTATVNVPGKIKNVILDSSHQMTDVDLLNNQLKCPLQLKFDKGKFHNPDRRYYQMDWRPDVWYHAIDGMKAGLHLEGDYFNMKRFLSATVWYNTGLLPWNAYKGMKPLEPVSFNLNYRNKVKWPLQQLEWFANARMLDGLRLGQIGLQKDLPGSNSLSMDFKAMTRRHAEYDMYPVNWDEGKWNNTINLSYLHGYSAWGQSGNIKLNLRGTGPFSDAEYAGMSAEWKHYFNVKKLNFRTRAFAQYITGSNVAKESKVYLAGATPEDMEDNKYTRSKAFFPSDWLGYGTNVNHFQQGGSLNLRGYAGYLAPYHTGDSTYHTYAGNAGAAVNLEMDFQKLMAIHPKFLSKYFSLNTYLFYDAGVITYEKNKLAPFRMDAGLGALLTIKSWGRFQTARPLSVRFDMPLFLSRTPYVDQDYFKFRWVLGIGRSF